MPMTIEEAYSVLGLRKNASEIEVKTAYKKLALKTHPDKNPGDQEAHQTFLRISEAYKRITDPSSFHDEDEGGGMASDDMERMFAHMFGHMGGGRGGMHFHVPSPEMLFFMMHMELFANEFDNHDDDEYYDYEDEDEDESEGKDEDEDDDDDDDMDMDDVFDDIFRGPIPGEVFIDFDDSPRRKAQKNVKIPKPLRKEKGGKMTAEERRRMDEELDELIAHIEGSQSNSGSKKKKGKREPLRKAQPPSPSKADDSKEEDEEATPCPAKSSNKKKKCRNNKKGSPTAAAAEGSNSTCDATEPMNISTTPPSSSFPAQAQATSSASHTQQTPSKPVKASTLDIRMQSTPMVEKESDDDDGWETESSDDMPYHRGGRGGAGNKYSDLNLFAHLLSSSIDQREPKKKSAKTKPAAKTEAAAPTPASVPSSSSAKNPAPHPLRSGPSSSSSATTNTAAATDNKRFISVGDHVIAQNK
jgi:curved DNA-binding protein CbpA